jgi:hypothetical protein
MERWTGAEDACSPSRHDLDGWCKNTRNWDRQLSLAAEIYQQTRSSAGPKYWDRTSSCGFVVPYKLLILKRGLWFSRRWRFKSRCFGLYLNVSEDRSASVFRVKWTRIISVKTSGRSRGIYWPAEWLSVSWKRNLSHGVSYLKRIFHVLWFLKVN